MRGRKMSRMRGGRRRVGGRHDSKKDYTKARLSLAMLAGERGRE